MQPRRARIYLMGMFLAYVLALVLIALAYQASARAR
jgi:hypothetical protein